MKKFYALLIGLFFSISAAQSQVTVLSQDFTGYNGTIPSIPAGWYLSFNSDTTVTSFYTTAGFYGMSAPAYKFGYDSTTVISPAFASGDTLKFWMKGNGTQMVQNTFFVYTSDDSITWTEIFQIDSISLTPAAVTIPISNTATRLKFYYYKPVLGFNVGLDDVQVISNSVGTSEYISQSDVRVYPNPSTTGVIRVIHRSVINPTLELWDMLGNRLHNITLKKNTPGETLLDLSFAPKGVYFLKVKSSGNEVVKKIVKN